MDYSTSNYFVWNNGFNLVSIIITVIIIIIIIICAVATSRRNKGGEDLQHQYLEKQEIINESNRKLAADRKAAEEKQRKIYLLKIKEPVTKQVIYNIHGDFHSENIGVLARDAAAVINHGDISLCKATARYCKYCGTKIGNNKAKFCNKCGKNWNKFK